jgi:hypothetical protein
MFSYSSHTIQYDPYKTTIALLCCQLPHISRRTLLNDKEEVATQQVHCIYRKYYQEGGGSPGRHNVCWGSHSWVMFSVSCLATMAKEAIEQYCISQVRRLVIFGQFDPDFWGSLYSIHPRKQFAMAIVHLVILKCIVGWYCVPRSNHWELLGLLNFKAI